MYNEDLVQRLVVKHVVRYFVGFAVLLMARYVVLSLPSIRNATIPNLPITPPFPITPLQISLAIVDTIIIFLILRFGKYLGNHLRSFVRRFPEIGVMTHMLIALIAIFIAYEAYSSIGYTILKGDLRWIYPTTFMVIAVIPIVNLVIALIRGR